VTTRKLTILPVFCAVAVSIGALGLSAQAGDPVDYDALYKIKAEGLERSQVMDTVWWLTDMYGPRLTNSPQMRAAADWTTKKLSEWGMVNVKQEPWGASFGRGWSNERTVVHVVKPTPWPVIAYAKAWSPGIPSATQADAVLAVLATDADLEKFRGKLKGKVVLLQPSREVPPMFNAPAATRKRT
jgi:hypothetical protein